MQESRFHAGALVVAVCLILLYCLLPLESSFLISGDETYVAYKAYLCSKGFVLYKQIWCDELPLMTAVLSWAFGKFGPAILVGRLVGVLFGIVLFVTFYQVVKERLGTWPAACATVMLVGSPIVFMISSSVMLEPPAFAFALVSIWALFRWCGSRHWGWLVASSCLMTLALEFKLTAAMVLPAMWIEIVISGWGKSSASRWRAFAIATIWSAFTVLLFVAISLLWGKEMLLQSWDAQAVGSPAPAGETIQDFPFPPKLLMDHAECVAAAVVGVALAVRKNFLRKLAFPIVLLATVLTIHILHKPWWNYYYLHFAIPLAWLAGFALHRAVQTIFTSISATKIPVVQLIVLSLAAGFVFVRTEKRLEATIAHISKQPRTKDNPIVANLIKHRDRTHWAYGEGIYLLHAQLIAPPETAVVSLKRYWSGQITTDQIIENCERYRVEQIVLPKNHLDSKWRSFLNRNFAMTAQDSNCVLYTSREILKGE